jgi:hypothetical protein
MTTPRWTLPTGGWRYHARAWRFRRGIWAPYVDAVAQWLARWSPPERDLLVIGPSAGYTLPASFLERFDTITAVDPDPTARWLFTRRFARTIASRRAFAWDLRDPLGLTEGVFDPARFDALLDAHRASAVLFSNVLGQLHLLDADDRHRDALDAWFSSLPTRLEPRSFASYHDRFTSALCPAIDGSLHSGGPLANEDLGALVYVTASESSAEPAEIVDHRTGNLFPGLPREFFSWQIAPRRWHVIEAVSHIRSAGRSEDRR